MELEIYQTGPLGVNTYVLKDKASKEAVIIDLGGSFKTIKSNLDKEGYTIKYILNTHGHFDHVFGEIEVIKDFPEIPILINKEDEAHYSRLQEELQMWGYHFQTEPLKPTGFIDENSKLEIGGTPIKILYTPGHSKGSLSYFIDNKLFSGDALFYNSIGRTDFFDGDYDTLINSIKQKMLPLPDTTIVYPGHGPSTTIKNEKQNNAYLR